MCGLSVSAAYLQYFTVYPNFFPVTCTFIAQLRYDGVLVKRAKDIVNENIIEKGVKIDIDLTHDLVQIETQYTIIANLVTKVENSKYTIEAAHRKLSAVNHFKVGPKNVPF